jgi:hypothetical protein
MTDCKGCKSLKILEKNQNISEEEICLSSPMVYHMWNKIPNCPCKECLVKSMCDDPCEELKIAKGKL